jgi:pSer/pThr/pTyr-binding forkhead associated (FHA) protein
MAKITLKFKEAVIKEIPIGKEITTIGRDKTNDIHIDNLAISSFHAKIINDSGQFIIEDTNSTNGTFVNNKRISKVSLNNNDVITLGKHTIIFTDPQAAGTETDKTQKIKKASLDATIVIDAKKQPMIEEGTTISEERVGCLNIIEGSTDKTEYDLIKRLTTIGKTETAEVKLKGFFAPKVAALINRTKDGYFISSAESGKKIKVNGDPIEGRYQLKDGDMVEVAGIKMQFNYKD